MSEAPNELVAGRYRRRVRLGVGAEGTVWRAEDLSREGGVVALKCTPSPPSPAWVAAVLGVEAPTLVRVRDAGAMGDGGFVVMDLVAGVALSLRPPDDALRVGADLADALEALHRKGLVHGDVKSENVLVGERATLVDLGFASEGTPGAVRGTLTHLAPESLLGERSPQTDLYALGITLARHLGGAHPFALDERDPASLHASLSPSRVIRPDVLARIPERVRDAVAWLLAWSPEDRPVSAAAWRARWCRDLDPSATRALTLVDAVPPHPPRIGGDEAVRALRDAALDPSHIGAVAVGASGAGRSRALHDALRQVLVEGARRGEVPDVRDALPDAHTRPTVVLLVDATAESLRALSEVVLRRRRFAPDAAAVTLLASATERPGVPALREVPVEALTRSASQRLLDALHGARVPASAVEAFCEVSAGLAGRMVELARRVGPAGMPAVTRATLYAALAREPVASSRALGPRAAALLAALVMLGETPVSCLRDAHDEDLAALLRVGAVHRRGAAVRADPSCALRDLDDAARREGARRVLALGPSRDAARGMARAWAHAALDELPRAWDDAVCAATRPDVPRDLALRWLREATPWAHDRTAHQRLLATLCLGGGDPQGALDALDGDATTEADALRVEALRRAGRRDDARALAARLHTADDPACRELGTLALARDALDRGDPAPAAALAGTSVSAAREPWSLELQCLAALARDDLDLADELLARGTLLAARAQDLPRRHRLRTLEGIVALRRGDASLALRAHRDALELALAQGDLEAAASYRVNLGGAALDAGDLGEALRALERSLEPLSAPGRARPLARALGNLASLLAWIGDVPAATRLAARAEEAARDAEDPVAQGFASGVGAELRGDLDALCAAAETCALHGDPARAGELRARAAARAAELGDVTRARALLPPGDDAMTTLAALAVELSAGAPPHALREALSRCDRAVSDDGAVEHALWHLKLSESAARRVGEAHRAEALRARRDARARALAATLPPALAETFARTWGAPAAVVAGTDARWRQLAAVTQGLNGEARLPELLERVMDAVITLTGAERGMVLLRDDSGALEPAVARDGEARALSDEARAFSRSVAERVARSGEALVTFDAASDARFDAAASVAAMQLRSILAVPLRVRDAVVGTVYVDDRLRAGAFDDGAVQVVLAFADAAALAIHNARTRRALEEALRRAERLSEQLDAVVAQQRAELEVTRESRSPDGVRGSYPEIIGRGPAMTRVLALIDRVAPTSMPVLLLGESGTGKELVARAVHAQSPRRAAAFVAENCGAIPETLLESVLFGHVRGAFTGADRARAGLFEAADGGTLFLDEIGEMSLAMQSRLLRVLQEGEVRPVGGSAMRRVDVRVIAATHRDLGEMVRAGRFREDLYYRLAVLVLPVPALRERREDIPALVAHFLAKHGGASIARSALARLVAAPWQGNVRELENVLRRAAALAPTGTVREDDLALAPDPAGRAEAPDGDIRHAVSEVERTLVEKALRAHRGNQSRAAKALGLSRFGLQKKLKRLGISARAIADEG